MAAIASAWLVGSITIPAQSFTVGGNAASLAAGTYYLRHVTDSLSLLEAVEDAIIAAVGGACTASIRRSRHVHLEVSPATSITWASATRLRNLLGFSGNLSSGTSHLADGISPLLWSPGNPATPKTIPGVEGYSQDHKTQWKSDDGSQLHTDYYSSETWQDLEWSHIVPSRLRVSTGTGGGTFHEFYEQCAKLGERFFHYELVTEDTADSSTNASLSNGLGPYVLRKFDGDWYRRRVRGADVSSPLDLPLHLVDEVE